MIIKGLSKDLVIKITQVGYRISFLCQDNFDILTCNLIKHFVNLFFINMGRVKKCLLKNTLKLQNATFSFQPMLHNWCNKGHGICYPICGWCMEKTLIGESSPFSGHNGFPLSHNDPLPNVRCHITVNKMY